MRLLVHLMRDTMGWTCSDPDNEFNVAIVSQLQKNGQVDENVRCFI